ncbi:galactose-specific lectin nattectin-like [Trematomus bernacchii]|uniref:galactose-specific lectin nattectin-like n=1 Tax=Trematomus bernacchii TaxID=40690 RepID=UPI00146ADDA0|nr:galactose-specific lectin nattectin-like [Trematomus bernacchii]
MASCLHFIVVLCLTTGLWSGANAQKEENPCYDPCKTCPSGWTPFEDHCYMYKHAAKTWADAEVDCIALGGNLASIPNKAVYTFIRQIVNTVTNANNPAWIGGNDLAKEGVWMWSDGTKFVTKLWAPHQPDNAGGKEDCLMINYRDLFNDLPCTALIPFVCGVRL